VKCVSSLLCWTADASRCGFYKFLSCYIVYSYVVTCCLMQHTRRRPLWVEFQTLNSCCQNCYTVKVIAAKLLANGKSLRFCAVLLCVLGPNLSVSCHCYYTRKIQCLCAATTRTHTHTHLTALCPGLPGWVGTRKVKPIWILLKQETVSGSGISWAIRKFAPLFRQITMPASHYSVFLQARCPSCRPTNSVKALNAVLCAASNTYNKAVIILIDS